MDEETARALLKKERYTEIYVWKDNPSKVYTPHFHRTDTKLIIQEGAIEITALNETRNYRPGDVVEIPKRTVHSARVGKEGCVYIVSERR